MANPLLLIAAGGATLLLLGGKKRKGRTGSSSTPRSSDPVGGINRSPSQDAQPEDSEGASPFTASMAKSKTHTIAVRPFAGGWTVSVVGGVHDGDGWIPTETKERLLSFGVRGLDRVVVRIPAGDLPGVHFDDNGFLQGEEISKAVYWTTSMARDITSLVDVQSHQNP